MKSTERVRVFTAVLFIASMFFPLKSFCGKFPGEINQINGTVEVVKEGKTQWLKAIEGLPVQLKDRIRTQSNSSCNLELDDGSLIFVAENTEASVEYIEITQEKHSSTLGLWFGKLLSNVKRSPSTKMKIKCPTAVISVRGTEFAVEVGSKTADIGVFEGEVAVSSATEKTGEELDDEASVAVVSVKPDQQTTVSQGEPPYPPTRLSELMENHRERLNSLRGRVQELREKLKREKPEYIDRARQNTLERFLSMKDKRDQLKEKLKNKRDKLR